MLRTPLISKGRTILAEARGFKLTLELDKPSVMVGKTVKASGKLTYRDRGIPNQTVTIYADGESAAERETDSGGGYSADLTFWRGGTYTLVAKYVKAVLEVDSEPVTLTVTKAPPTVTTTLSSTGISSGGSVTDTATVRGLEGYPVPTGDVAFSVQPEGGAWTEFDREALDSSGRATSSPYKPPKDGAYYFKASYGGDDVYLPGESDPAAEKLTVGAAAPTPGMMNPVGIHFYLKKCCGNWGCNKEMSWDFWIDGVKMGKTPWMGSLWSSEHNLTLGISGLGCSTNPCKVSSDLIAYDKVSGKQLPSYWAKGPYGPNSPYWKFTPLRAMDIWIYTEGY
jgi:hypothetical protein